MDVKSVGPSQFQPRNLHAPNLETPRSPASSAENPIPATPEQASAARLDQEKRPQNSQSSSEELTASVKAMNDFVKPLNNSLEFSVDDDTGKTVVKVVDLSTKEVLRQIPSEEMLAIAKALDTLKGLLIQQKA